MNESRLTRRILALTLALVLAGALLPLGSFGTHDQVQASPSATSLALVWESTDIGSITSIAIDDVDGDGATEIVCASLTSFDKGTYTYHGYIHIFNALTHELEWKSEDIGYITDVIATDLDADGNHEILAQTYLGRSAIIGNCYGYVHVFDGASQAQIWKSDNIGEPRGCNLVVADLDGDGIKDIIAGGMHYYSCTRHGHVYVFDGADFSQKWKSPDVNSPSKIAVADMDDDGLKEIILGNCVTDCTSSSSEGGYYYPGYIYVFDGMSFGQEWKSGDIGNVVSLAVGDVDDDGTKELVTGVPRTLYPNTNPDRGYIYVFDGSTYSQEWKSQDVERARCLGIIDIDNDSTKEIIARTARPHMWEQDGVHTGHLYVFDGKTHSEEWQSDNLGDAYCLAVDDIENDGVQEILTKVLSDSGCYLGIWNGETHDQVWQSTDDVGSLGIDVIMPFVDDQGDTQIVVGGGEGEGGDLPYPDELYHGHLYVFAASSEGQTDNVGWETYPISKARLLLPWIVLFAAVIAGASLLALRRGGTDRSGAA